MVIGVTGIIPEKAGLQRLIRTHGIRGTRVEVNFLGFESCGTGVGEGDAERDEMLVGFVAFGQRVDFADADSVWRNTFEGDALVRFGRDLVRHGVIACGLAAQGADGFATMLVEGDLIGACEHGLDDPGSPAGEMPGDTTFS